MKSPMLICLGLAVLVGPLVTTARAEDLTPEEVRNAIARGVKYLKNTQRADGSWPDYMGMGQPGGVTGLCTLALLNAGLSPEDQTIQQALKNLRQRRPQNTYVVALQTMVLCRAEPKTDRALIGRNVEWLQRNQIREGPRAGMWSYPNGNGDASNTQFALLALHEAERAAEAGLLEDVRVSGNTWKLAKTYWENAQNPDHSWGYYPPLEGTGSMTCAGIASLVIAADAADEPDAKVDGDKIDACARAEGADSGRVEAALQWLGRGRFSVAQNPGQRAGIWHFYYLYGLERAGRLTARRFIGNHDWYREGSEHLIRDKQDNLSGFFKGAGHAEDDRNISTSLALLFLSKGRWPVLLAKLKHSPGDEWNQRRHDVHNLTLYVESRWKMDLTWQIVDVEKASIEDLLQSPVLFFSSSQSPLPSGEEKQKELAQKLRGYVDRGGFLFAEADTCANGFDQGFRKLMNELAFPEPEYKMKVLDVSHPIWHYEEKVPDDQQRPIWGIDYGCRTSVVYFPRYKDRPPLSCLWELSRAGRHQKFSKSVQDQIAAGRSIGINVLAYATNRELQDKDMKFQETATDRGPRDKVERGRLEVVKLRHPGGCDSAPRALANLMERAAKELKIRADIHPKLISIIDKALLDYPTAFMHGRNRFQLTDKEREALKTYVERGGLLFADSVCASQAFTDSFQAEMKKMFPKNPLVDIPVDPLDPIWTTKYGGFDLRSVQRRDPQPGPARGPVRAALRNVPPKLKAIKFGDRYGVIFSEFDLSCALEKQDSAECRGYTRDDAARIGMNVLLYSLQQ